MRRGDPGLACGAMVEPAGGHMTERPDPARRHWPVRDVLIQTHAALYRATGGRIGHHVPGHPPMLLLAHVGAKSGKRRTSGLTYLPYDGSFVVVGSNGGGARSPGWVYNLRAFPDTEVQVGPETIQVRAREADDGERQRLWPEAARYHPAWGRFQQRAPRPLPIVILTPRRPLGRVVGLPTTGRRSGPTERSHSSGDWPCKY
jgi:F420H(2)-dependent quinone reductase